MKNKPLSLLIICCLVATKFYGQADSITMSYIKANTNDTVWLMVSTTPNTKPGTLMVVTTSSITDLNDTAYFPIIDTASTFGIIIPPGFRSGILKVNAFFYPKIFTVTGKAISKIKGKTINVMLITTNQQLYNKALNLTADNHFTLPSLVFEKKATIIFNYASSTKTDHPDVSIEQIPSGKDFTENIFSANIVLTAPEAKDSIPAKKELVNHSISTDTLNKKYKGLQSVTVTGTRKSNAEKFNQLYTTPLFNDLNEKVIDCIDNTNILSYPDCLTYLQSQIAGIMPGVDKFGESILKWRGHETKAFFIDEIAVDIDELLSVNVADIAIIKAFPPPFAMAGGNGDGGAIAIYTKRGEFRTAGSSDNKWLYAIKGYSPPMHTLFSGN